MCYISRPGCSTCYLLCAGVGVLGSQLYAAGGHDGPLVRKSVEVYDAQANTWRLVCDMNMCRRNAGQTRAARYQRWNPGASHSHLRCFSSKASVPLMGCCT